MKDKDKIVLTLENRVRFLCEAQEKAKRECNFNDQIEYGFRRQEAEAILQKVKSQL